MLSDHFVFSRDWVGSRSTGYARTRCYRRDETKLARAMTISGAAASSAAGKYTKGWWSFVMTLVNARLGYWMENPRSYRGASVALSGEGGPAPPAAVREHRTRGFWLGYLLREVTGAVHDRTRLVHLSDGGHTGDNLGLMPLIQRRCRTIVVSDAEADAGYGFGSFVHAVRMAQVEENTSIEIDLEPLRPRAAREGHPRRAVATVAVGKVRYPDAPEGTIVYFKATVPSGVPVHVAAYETAHPAFPHESTADQFFDDAQFESYRALGEWLGLQGGGAVPGH